MPKKDQDNNKRFRDGAGGGDDRGATDNASKGTDGGRGSDRGAIDNAELIDQGATDNASEGDWPNPKAFTISGRGDLFGASKPKNI